MASKVFWTISLVLSCVRPSFSEICLTISFFVTGHISLMPENADVELISVMTPRSNVKLKAGLDTKPIGGTAAKRALGRTRAAT
jgi:hypothetical protein